MGKPVVSRRRFGALPRGGTRSAPRPLLSTLSVLKSPDDVRLHSVRALCRIVRCHTHSLSLCCSRTCRMSSSCSTLRATTSAPVRHASCKIRHKLQSDNTPVMLQSQCNRQHAVQRAARMSEVAVHHRDRLDRGTHAGCTGPRESLDRIGAFIRKQIGAPAPALPADGIADLSTVSPR